MIGMADAYQKHTEENMDNAKTTKLSENFWKEMQARGFNIKQENGGRQVPEHRFSWVERSPEGYRLKSFHNKERIVFISGETFIKTVEKIENMLKYKLFG